jgi:hypothetical protein
MKRLVMLFAVMALLAVSAAAQRGGGGGQGGFGGGQGFGGRQGGMMGQMAGPMILMNPQVQAELKLTEDQIAKLREALRPAGGPGGPGGAGGGRGGFGADPQAREQMRLEQEKKIKEILSAEQYKRYQQISLQLEGPSALARKEIADKVGLSDSQREKIQALIEEQRATMRDMFQGGAGGDRQAMMEEMQKLRKETDQKILGLLTAEQKKTWEAMLGKPFQL